MAISVDNLQPLMMMAGLGIVCWLLMRSRTRRRRSAPQVMLGQPLKHNANASSTPPRYSGTASLGAPPEILQWQVELHDLGRELKAELDSKLIAVRTMTHSYEQARQHLQETIQLATRLELPSDSPLERVRQLDQQGWPASKIAGVLGMSEEDVATILALPERQPLSL